MPRGDRTGPMGAGPRTGRGMGYCSGYSQPGFMNPGPGMGLARGFGRAAGFGRGMGRGTGMGQGAGYPPSGQTPGMPPSDSGPSQTSPEDELNFLKQQAENLRQQMKKISQRIEELEKKKR